MGELLLQPLTWGNFLIFLVMAVIFLLIILGMVTYAIYFERKILGYMQLRPGPNQTGKFGLLQTVADVLKLLMKEDTIPQEADRPLFKLAPVITFVPSFVVLATIPYSENLYFANLDIGVLYYVALSGLSTIGIVLAGWASNNKYALIGGMRSGAQLISYAIPLVISAVGVVMISGTMNLIGIVERQAGWFWNWNFLTQILAFIVFIIAAVAELNRSPFDLPEAESELVAGYHVEYSGFRFAFFMLAEYVYMIAMSALITVLFLGGWHAPAPFLAFIPGIIWFIIKFCCVFFFIIWLRGTMPRIRVDQLMSLGWKVLLPLSLANIFITAIVMEIIRAING
ncbi:NADH-quinone oxidoreductase subunit H [Insulibacter thermoxylanivorax]|uniref:NADH-quinone oxidoreductase subunit H n=1 Tax=Insulibacter thermoxylanivorax TaxID=2749268 RepID=A0A916VH46_9BACL|nr:NADH-quinone oxidoreductase subunit NuoH [Insulibacter thermoxylanivorax]GFR39394.1 NADH-quinone oxidoreductase subunit H [Insulibacter thermoxylanivorax]